MAVNYILISYYLNLCLTIYFVCSWDICPSSWHKWAQIRVVAKSAQPPFECFPALLNRLDLTTIQFLCSLEDSIFVKAVISHTFYANYWLLGFLEYHLYIMNHH